MLDTFVHEENKVLVNGHTNPRHHTTLTSLGLTLLDETGNQAEPFPRSSLLDREIPSETKPIHVSDQSARLENTLVTLATSVSALSITMVSNFPTHFYISFQAPYISVSDFSICHRASVSGSAPASTESKVGTTQPCFGTTRRPLVAPHGEQDKAHSK